jgi:hypothetical protein
LRIIKAEHSLVESRSKTESSQVIVKQKNDIHTDPITLIRFNIWENYALTFAGGLAEVWDPETLELPTRF